MSDGQISYRYTFCVILDRNEIFKIPNYEFLTSGHVTPEDMEMSEIASRIEWKHSRSHAGPPCGRNRPLKSRNYVFRHEGTFFQSFGKFGKWKMQKKIVVRGAQTFSGRMVPVRGPSWPWGLR